MQKPKKLSPGDVIGLVAPASPGEKPYEVERAKAYIEELGYQVVIAPHVDLRRGFVAASEEERAAAIEECQRILYEDSPYTVVCYDMDVQAISNRWTGFSTDGIGLFKNERIDTYVNVRPAD